MSKILIRDATIINENRKFKGNVVISNELIERIYEEPVPVYETYDEIIDAHDKVLIPGVIDDHVHFREPGLTHKADIASESRAAVAGGITSFMDMPNTIPQTTTQKLIEEKIEIAEEYSMANFSFYAGATNNNLEELLKTNPRKVCGIKIFMGSSTGNMSVSNKVTLKNIFSQSGMLLAVHCEDEKIINNNLKRFIKEYGENIPVKFHPLIRNEDACYKSSAEAVELAAKYNSRLHVLHVSTEKELELFKENTCSKDKRITSEVCVHHLWFSDSDYDKYGTRIKWNPAVKSSNNKHALLNAVKSGKIDVIATDHAPHTIDEKNNFYLKAPSGGPMIQHSLVAMLEFYRQGKISLENIIDKMCHTPADIFQIEKRGYIRENYYADLVLIEPDQEWNVTTDNLFYKCKWSPFENQVFHSAVTHTFVNGKIAFRDGEIIEPAYGKQLIFNR
jgi:dihydroorotase